MRHGTQIYHALQQLIRLKDIKDKMDIGTATAQEIEDYQANKDPAWRRAREELFGLQDSTLSKLKPGEPCFLLRGYDRHSAGLVYQWENRARKHGTPEAKCAEAHAIGVAMELLENRRDPT